MIDRTGWHCTACNHYFQTAAERPAPTECRYCGRAGSLDRIDHEQPAVDVTVGDVVSCEIIGRTRQYVVGEVVEVTDDRLVVEARDGTGTYTVKPQQFVDRREDAGEAAR